MLIDSHTHPHFPDYQEQEVTQLLDDARAAGIGALINVGTDVANSQKIIHFIETYGHHPVKLFATVGIHPHEAAAASETAIEELRSLVQNNESVVAIGEIGLDYYYEHSPQDAQQRMFREQIRLAKDLKLPIVIHCRDAFEDCFQILDEEDGWRGGGVFHCFTGDKDLARKIVKKGWFVSFSGIVTFKSAKDLQEAALNVPRDRFLIETDAPYLAPVPKRGKRNEPAYLRYTAEFLAELKGVGFADIERITARNTKELFGLDIELPDDKPKLAYRIRNSLYLNITNQCTLACRFCPKFDDWMVKGHYLELPGEPTVDEIMEAAGDPTIYKEVVFCGFGESTLRLPVLLEVARLLKDKGAPMLRMDTEGLGNLVHGRNIVPELAENIDALSVSLNAPDPETYAKLCPSRFGQDAYPAVKNFILEAKKYFNDLTASVVGVPNLDIKRCQEIAEQELGVKFRLRPYDEVG